MRMKILSAAVLAGLGVAGTTQAVHVNPDGLGQVLIYPYYTVQNGFDTYVHVVNTTSQVKAVKVRFLEGMNSQEVLDFNLYLSPYDEWTGNVVRTATGAGLTTDDTSCVAPAALPANGSATPQPFQNFVYGPQGMDDSEGDLDRTREGYVEVIEMGVVANATLAAAATHVQGVPANCAAVRAAAASTFNTDDASVTLPTGGLYGFVSTIDVQMGRKTSIDAVALDDFFEGVLPTDDLHATPGSVLPNLSQVDPAEANVLNGVTVINSPVAAGRPSVDAVSFTMMHDVIANDYAVDGGRSSQTDWVITFPTKAYYVNTLDPTPFFEVWDGDTSSSCDPVTITYYDREEGRETVTEGFSPPPPSGAPTQLCTEVNTLTVKPSDAADPYASLYGAVFTRSEFGLAEGFSVGWMSVAFDATTAQIPDANGLTYFGLPVVGFSAISNINNTTVVDGVTMQSNYMSSVTHKSTRDIR